MGVALNFPNSPVEGQVTEIEGIGFAFLEGVWRRGPTQKGEVAVPPGVTLGDVKQSFQASDHGGWVKLDGRAVSALPAVQQTNAIALGFATNLPDATNAVPMQNGGAPGAVSGSWVLTQANLPAVNLTAASGGASTPSTNSTGAHTHVTDSQGDHAHPGAQSTYGSATPTTESAWDRNEPDEYRGAHTHTAQSAGAHAHTVSVPAHTHVVALGGSATPIAPKAISCNQFVFLSS